jgi:hypothetical protein
MDPERTPRGWLQRALVGDEPSAMESIFGAERFGDALRPVLVLWGS